MAHSLLPAVPVYGLPAVTMWHFGDQGSGEFSSFGFRGEALSAISAMDDMTIATKTPESAAFPQQKDRHLCSWLVWRVSWSETEASLLCYVVWMQLILS